MLLSSPQLVTRLGSNRVLIVIGQLLKVASSTGRGPHEESIQRRLTGGNARWASYRYHAVPGNIDRLSVFGQRLRRLWWLIRRRRSQSSVPFDRVIPISSRWIPAPRVLHPYPIARFLATDPKVGAVCVEALVRIGAGGGQ